jgi:hypothetical protein
MKIRYPLNRHARRNDFVWGWWAWRRKTARRWRSFAGLVDIMLEPMPPRSEEPKSPKARLDRKRHVADSLYEARR